jgi:hypothetical protein
MKKSKKPPGTGTGTAIGTGTGTASASSPSKSRERISSAKALDASFEKVVDTDTADGDCGGAQINSDEPPPTAEEIALLEAEREIIEGSNPGTASEAKPSTTSDLSLLAEIMLVFTV